MDDLTITLKATHIDDDYRHVTDNDHSNATGALNGNLIPAPAFSIASLRTFCLGTLTNVTTDRAFECSEVEYTTKQYEINIVSDFDGPFNFTVGAYDYLENTFNQYNIQNTAYLLVNDFDQHPYVNLFGTERATMATYGGSLFYGIFASTLAAQASDILTAVGAAGGAGTAAGTAAAISYLQDTTAPAIATACGGALAVGLGTCVKSLPAQAGGLIADQRTQRNSSAVYGEFYWDALDNLRVTLGARYMDDRFATRTMQGLTLSLIHI